LIIAYQFKLELRKWSKLRRRYWEVNPTEELLECVDVWKALLWDSGAIQLAGLNIWPDNKRRVGIYRANLLGVTVRRGGLRTFPTGTS